MTPENTEDSAPVCSVEELARRRAAGEQPFVLDVRTAEELALASLEDVHHIPMQEVPERLAELDPRRGEEIIVMCHHGVRSHRVAEWLRTRGFGRVRNLAGGIDAWSELVDDGVPRY